MSTPVNALRSPEVNADRTVTLRFQAPEATKVELVGEILQGQGPRAMTRGGSARSAITAGPPSNGARSQETSW